MKKLIKISAVAVMIFSLSSCGIFKKDCGCPHFGTVKQAVKANQA
jgi:hypothetical protein